ncbi:hypothetical protein FQ004_16740, partial [Escherichia coli]|nr:hypothetical protein [Escherichia coli]
ADRNRSHWSTSKTPSYTKSVSWQHHQPVSRKISARHFAGIFQWMTGICTENIPPFNPLTDEDN